MHTLYLVSLGMLVYQKKIQLNQKLFRGGSSKSKIHEFFLKVAVFCDIRK